MLKAICGMRRANEEMYKELDLLPTVYSEDRIVKAKIDHLWTVLVDSGSKRMRGFGKLSSNCAEAIDFRVKKLLEWLEEIK